MRDRYMHARKDADRAEVVQRPNEQRNHGKQDCDADGAAGERLHGAGGRRRRAGRRSGAQLGRRAGGNVHRVGVVRVERGLKANPVRIRARRDRP